MKKIILALFVAFLLTACNSQKTPVASESEITGYAVDMSAYKGVSSTEHKFIGISPAELLKVIEEKGSAIVYLGYKDCHVCQEATRYVNEVAQELDVNVYYLDCASEQYPLKDEMFTSVVNALSSILETNSSGEKAIFTPHLFTIINGEPQSGHISVVNSWQEGNPSEASVKELKDIYTELMKPFAK